MWVRRTQLHTVAAYFPDAPDAGAQRSAVSLVESLAALYPCSHCKDDFQEAVREHPPQCVAPLHLTVYEGACLLLLTTWGWLGYTPKCMEDGT